jgi:short-subunit dehydrogenase
MQTSPVQENNNEGSMVMTKLAGKSVLLTGASRGIGRFMAMALAQEQATVVAVSRSQDKLDQVCADIQAGGGKAFAFAFDISQVEQLPDLVEQVNQRVGSVDILVNNAAIEIYRAFQNYTLRELQAVLSTNLLAAMELARLLLPQMLHQNSGHIVNIASTAAKKGHPYDSAYSASKGGLLLWSDALRQELVGTGVSVSVICPGYVSEAGMLVDTQVPAPAMAGKVPPEAVAAAVVQAIQQDRAETLVDENTIAATLTKLLFATGQFSPSLCDAVYRWLEIPKLNQIRIEKMMQRQLSEEAVLNPSLKQY